MAKRLFIAVNVPGEVKKRLYGEAKNLLKNIPEKKLVEEENIHLTVKFLGSKSVEEEKKIIEALEGVKVSSFEASVSGMGFFTGFHRTIMFYDIGKGKEELKELSEKVNQVLGEEDKKFKTHLTVVRVKKVLSPGTREKLKKEAREEGRFKVGSFELMESRLSPKGPEYSVVKSFKLS